MKEDLDHYMKGIEDGYNAQKVDKIVFEQHLREKIAEEVENLLDLPPITDEDYLVYNVITDIANKIRNFK